MRTRTAKKLAQRIDLAYFRRPHPFRRWRTFLSVGAPLAGLLWLGGMAAAGSRAPYSSGPVSLSHAFTEMKCEVCHVRDEGVRAHVTDTACLSCHDAPAHADTQRTPPDCATCHREHQGRVRLAGLTGDRFCTDCHGNLTTTKGAPAVAANVGVFPASHPEFAAARGDARDAATIRFNHAVHARPDLRGPQGPERLECAGCHKPEIARAGGARGSRIGRIRPVTYEQECARCHVLYFDERIDRPAPHEEPAAVRAFVQAALREYIAANPQAVTEPGGPPRRIPLNFPPPPEPPARNAQEWLERRTARAEDLLWGRTCAECHQVSAPPSAGALPQVAPVGASAVWMPKARFDHAPHLMLECTSCHRAETSRLTSDVLMPAVETCATCHAPSRGASAACIECHEYHDWSRTHPAAPIFKLTDFRQE